MEAFEKYKMRLVIRVKEYSKEAQSIEKTTVSLFFVKWVGGVPLVYKGK